MYIYIYTQDSTPTTRAQSIAQEQSMWELTAYLPFVGRGWYVAGPDFNRIWKR